MIVVLTGLNHGGILQFAMRLTAALGEMGEEYRFFVPEKALRQTEFTDGDRLVPYAPPKTKLERMGKYSSLGKKIDALKPKLILAADDALLTQSILRACKSKKAMVIHDVKTHMQSPGLYRKVVETLRRTMHHRTLNKLAAVILLSQNSCDIFGQQHEKYKKKAILFPLGAHTPHAEPIVPDACQGLEDREFYLFFGRIDAYKGVEDLLGAYHIYSNETKEALPLVIAGQALGAEHRFDQITQKGVIRLGGYVSDGEMRWLFARCRAVMLPYREASQSGVLPIAYEFGKPVIATNIPGLAECVEDGTTGLLVNSIPEFARGLGRLSDDALAEKLSLGAKEYYRNHYDWKKNLSDLLEKLLPLSS